MSSLRMIYEHFAYNCAYNLHGIMQKFQNLLQKKVQICLKVDLLEEKNLNQIPNQHRKTE